MLNNNLWTRPADQKHLLSGMFESRPFDFLAQFKRGEKMQLTNIFYAQLYISNGKIHDANFK